MVDTTELDLETAPVSPFTEQDDWIEFIDEEEEDWSTPKEDEPDKEDDEESAKPEDEEIKLSKKDYEALKEANRQSTQEGQKLAWVDRVRVDKYDFIKLYEADQAIAAKVLQHVGEEKDPRLLYNELRKEKYWEDDRVVQREELLQAIEEKEIKKEFNKMIKATWLDLDSKSGKAFTEEYNFLTDNGKRVTSENVDSFVSKAMKLSWVKNIAQLKEKTDKELLWAGTTTSKNTNTDGAKVKWSYFDSFEKKWPSSWY